jgi:predicted membrane protein
MKMNGLFFGGLFWGILISLFGLSIVLRYAFNINIPFVRIFFGVIIILFGLKLIVGSSGKYNFKKNRPININHGGREVTVVFSSGTVDLSQFIQSRNFPQEVTVVFGNATILVPDTLNLEITSTTVFGTTILPDRSYAGFGEDIFVVNSHQEGEVHRIETTCVFGRLEFEKVKTVPENPQPEKQNNSY